MEEQKSISQGQKGVADRRVAENATQGRFMGTNKWDTQKQGVLRLAESKPADAQDQAGVDMAWRVERDQGGTTVDSLKFLYENDSFPGAFECKFEVKNVNDVVGKGVFTTQHIKKGAVVWNHKKSLAASYTIEELKKLLDESPELAAPVLDYGYMWRGTFFLPLDASKYVNHGKTPSIKLVKSKQELADLRGVPVDAIPPHEYNLEDAYATRDLVPGDEILEDYMDYHETAGYLELCRKYNSIPSIEVGKMF